MSGLRSSRRAFLRGMIAVAGASASIAGEAPKDKISQAEAGYQGSPNDGDRCDGCVMFIAKNNTCKIVEGMISPQGWCRFHAPEAQ